MEAGTAIDRVMQFTDDQNPADASYNLRRAKYLEMAQQTLDRIWNHRPWSWRVVNGTITVPAGLFQVAVPSDFVEFGPFGGVFDLNGTRLDEVSPAEVQRYQVGSAVTDRPGIFSVFDYSATDGLPLFQIPKNSSQLVFTVYYCSTSPTLSDTTTAGASGLTRLPVQYHFQPFLVGFQARALRDAGDARADSVYEALYTEGLQRMVVEQQLRRSTTRRMPRTLPRGAW